jgi:hypothetical protein
MTYDLRRLRVHGLITRIPRTRRYQITDTGLTRALLFTRAHDLWVPKTARTARDLPVRRDRWPGMIR